MGSAHHQPWQPTSTTAAPPSPCLAARTTVFVFLRQHSASEPHITTQMCTFHKITKRSTTAASDLDLLTTTPPTSGSKQAQSRIPLRHPACMKLGKSERFYSVKDPKLPNGTPGPGSYVY